MIPRPMKKHVYVATSQVRRWDRKISLGRATRLALPSIGGVVGEPSFCHAFRHGGDTLAAGSACS
eukprot:scaffold3842_cov150-Pinguiococcus_pyrenoidosus.AAC.1